MIRRHGDTDAFSGSRMAGRRVDHGAPDTREPAETEQEGSQAEEGLEARGVEQLTEREVRRLSRADLLELLLRESRENERLRRQLEQAKRQLASREIEIQTAGSLAEAALRLNEVFEAADRAAAQYVENVRRKAEEGMQWNGQ